jgi:uncharacterized protein (TIRG00374 family)
VTVRGKSWKKLWRVGLCFILLVSVFHSIFLKEAALELKRRGANWEAFNLGAKIQAAWTIGPEQLWHTLKLISPLVFGCSLIFMGLTVVLGMVRWRMVMAGEGLNLPWRRAWSISLIAHFFNSLLLGSTGGDLIKAYYAARETHHKKTEAVVTVFIDRLLGLWAMLLFACIMMIPNATLLLAHRPLGVCSIVTLGMLGGATAVLVAAFWGGVSRVLPGSRNWIKRLPKADVIERSLEACRRTGGKARMLATATIISMLLNTFCVIQVWILARGLGLTIPPMALFVIVPIIICISALPITPNGLGVRENLFAIMLMVPEIGVPPASALSLSLLAYAGSLAWSLAGGVVYLALREKEHLSEITESPENP